jgi:hypothetical protein
VGRAVLSRALDRRLIALVWICGFMLMAAVYAIGPQHFLATCEALIAATARFLGELSATLMWRAFEVTRAAAIALYAVFVVLAVLAARRGLRIGGMLVGVTLVFLLLVRTDWYDPGTKWLAAALLTAVAAGMATKLLLYPPPSRHSARSWGSAYRGNDGQNRAP